MVVAWPALMLAATMLGIAVMGAQSITVVAPGRNLVLVGLFLATAVWAWRASARLARVVVILSFAVAAGGMLASGLTDTITTTVSAVTGRGYDSAGRLAGFYLQPNMAASQLIILFIVWSLLARRGFALTVVGAIALFVLEMSTGSRAGMAVGTLIGVMAIHSQQSVQALDRASRRTRQVLCLGGTIVIGMSIILTVRASTNPLATNDGEFDIFNRVVTALRLEVSPTDLALENTTKVRVDAAELYLRLVMDHPLVGHGIGASDQLQRQSGFRAPHNMYLQWAFEYGIPMVVCWLVLLGWMMVGSRRRQAEEGIGSNAFLQFVVLMVMMGLFSNSIAALRPVWIATALLGVAWYRGAVHSRTTGRLTHCTAVSSGDLAQTLVGAWRGRNGGHR